MANIKLNTMAFTPNKLEQCLNTIDFYGPDIVRHIRKALGLTQADTADLLGCSTGTVSRAECGYNSKWLELETEFVYQVIAVLDDEDKALVLSAAGLLYSVIPAAKDVGLAAVRENFSAPNGR